MRFLKPIYLALGDLSLKRKVFLVIAIPCFFLVIAAILISSFIEFHFFKQRFVSEHQSAAKMLAINLESSVSFEDPVDASEILTSLNSRASVGSAQVYFRGNQLLAEYSRDGFSELILGDQLFQGTGFWGEVLVINEDIVFENRVIGKLVLQVDLSDVDEFVSTRAKILFGVFVGALLVSVFLLSFVGNLISQPILDLARTAERITQEEDYSRRQTRHYNDETGSLVDAFNAMMEQIEKREAIINANTERFKRYFELGIVGLGVLDSNMVWLESNDQMAEILGYDHEDLRSMTWHELLAEGQSVEHKEKLLSMLIGESDQFFGDCWLKSKGGKDIYAMMALRRVSAIESDETQYIVLVQDITERKEYEEQLFKAKENAEELSKAKDEFLSVMSHELRTPLNPIIGFGELLMEDIKDTESKHLLDIMMRSAKHLLELIDNILNYVRIQKDVIELDHASVDIDLVGSDIAKLMSERAAKKGLGLDYSMEVEECLELGNDEKIFVQGDETRLRQIMLNFIANAIKFTEEGRVHLKLKLSPGDGEFTDLRILVKDTGSGIPVEQLDRIFQPFTQLNESLTREYSGIGLGLAICKRIVDAMGGEIGVSSVINVGSEFWSDIPVKISTVEHSVGVGFGDSPSLKPVEGAPKVLLVEDDPYNKAVAEKILARIGVSVDSAEDGVQALDRMSESVYDLVLMDIQMPRMNGYEAARSIRNLAADSSGVPIVGVTAHAGLDTRESCRRSGMNDFLPKPYTPEALAEVVNRWILKEKEQK